MKPEDSIDSFLKPTKYCDSDNPKVIALAKELTKNDKTQKEKALSIFQYVRDEIRYLMNYEYEKASETLDTKFGACGSKTNLQVALLRAANIPARYCLVTLKKECLKGIVSKFYFRVTPEIIHHSWGECFIDGKWVICDLTYDKKLVDSAYKKGIFTKSDIPTIDWDGENDLNIFSKWFIENKGTRSSFDDILGGGTGYPKILLRFVSNRSNSYTEKLRNE